jgi:glutathione S-transferase
MAPHMILEALQVDYHLIKVDRKSQGQKSKEYLALNPAGRIPTLVKDELVIFESPAICLYLGEMHPEAGLIPLLGEDNRAQLFQWMMYLTNTLQAELMVYFYPEKHCESIEAQKEIIASQEVLIHQALSLLNNELASKDYLLGDKVSICDYFLFMLLVWADELEFPPLSFKNLSRYLKRLVKLPAVIEVCAKENYSLSDYQ